jgi:iron complex outermembrane recepter protein
MLSFENSRRAIRGPFVFHLAMVLFAIAALVRPAEAQQDPWLRLLTEASAIQTAQDTVPTSELHRRLESLQEEVLERAAAEGLALAGLTRVPVATALPETLRRHAFTIADAVMTALRNRPGPAFHLGRVQLEVVEDAFPVPTTTAIDATQFRARNLRVLPDALNLMPGVAIQRIGPRNERGVFVRGFDARQVPLFIDGIPIYVPYDGYVDMDRFLTDDIAEIQVSKGFTTVTSGPNALGGAINVVSRQPSGPLDLDLGTGYAAGGQVSGFANAGTRWKRFWLQGGFAWLSSDFVPLSGEFRPVPLQPNSNRANSYQTDYRGRVQVAYTPRDGDQYSFGNVEQRGEKGNPPYAGTDARVRPRFWQWPQWDKRSFYTIVNKQFGPDRSLRARLFRDQFDNLLRAFDNATYSTQTRPSSFNSPYDDDTWGGNLVFQSLVARRHSVKTSMFFKDDAHREGNIGEPERKFRDQSWSWGVEDSIAIAERVSAIAGVSVDYLSIRNAQNLVNGVVTTFPRNDVLAVNPMAGVFFAQGNGGRWHATYARKTRLPTIKDRYSYRLGQAIPNPDLMEERADHFELGYRQIVGLNSSFEVSGFWSNTEKQHAALLSAAEPVSTAQSGGRLEPRV